MTHKKETIGKKEYIYIENTDIYGIYSKKERALYLTENPKSTGAIYIR